MSFWKNHSITFYIYIYTYIYIYIYIKLYFHLTFYFFNNLFIFYLSFYANILLVLLLSIYQNLLGVVLSSRQNVCSFHAFSIEAEGDTESHIYDFFVLIFCISNLIPKNVFRVCSINVSNLHVEVKGSWFVGGC